MVTQAEAPSSSPPRPGARNSLTTAAAIRRGEIKISNPIPWEDAQDEGVPVPASLPAAPAAQIAPSPGAGRQEPPTLADIRPPQPPQFNGLYDGRPPTRTRRVVPNGNGGVTMTTTMTPTPEDPSGQHSRAGKSVEVLPTQPPITPRHQQNRSSLRNKRNSGVVSGNTIRASYDASGDDSSKENSKKRGSGSLRAVLRKMFGGSGSKKEKDYTPPSRKGSKAREIGDWMVNDNDHDAVTRSNTTHNINQLASDRKAPIDPMKLPVHEITPRTALGSHLPFPMNVNAPQPSPPGVSTQHPYNPHPLDPSADPSKVPRRRATLPSLILSPSDMAALNALWDKEIEAGAIGEETRKGTTPTPDIGMAITSASGHASKRRSRSADALNELAKEQEIMQQQTHAEGARASGRQAEIDYWRASLTAGVQTHDFQQPRGEPLKREKSAGSSSGSGTSMKTAHLAQSGDEKAQPEMDEDDDDSLIQRRTPPNERASFEKPSPEDVRPAHPFDRPAMLNQSAQAFYAHSRNFSRPVADVGGVEKTRESLEDRLSKLEGLVQKMENTSNRRTIILENAPQGRHGRGEGSNGSSDSNYSRDQKSRHASNMMQNVPEYAQHNQEHSPLMADGSSPITPSLPGNSQLLHNMYSGSTFSPNSSVLQHPYIHHNPPPAVGQYDFATSSNVDPSSIPSPNIYDHLAPLYAALGYERSKRKEFAVQMQNVHQQLTELNSLVRGSPSDPHDKSKENCYKPVHARGPGPGGQYQTSGPEDAFGSQGSMMFNTDDDGWITRAQQSRFSGLDYDSSEEDDETNSRGAGRTRKAEADADSGAEKEIYGTPKETMLTPQQSMERGLPGPTTPQVQKSSKIPTPKQSMKNLVQKQPSFSSMPGGSMPGGSMPGTGSSSTVGTSTSTGSGRNRFGFKGGRGR